jgi:tRNA pseudouridine38-40 synthase
MTAPRPHATLPAMRCIRMRVQYDGTNYHGWQEQPGLDTIQGTLVETLATILGERPAVEGASRTDAGVHAMGQAATFKTERNLEVARLQAALNSRLPADIAVGEMAEAPPGFRPSHDAVDKHYRYRIWRGPIKPVFEDRFVWHWHRPLDAEPMRSAARLLTGRYDFKSFQTGGTPRENTVREIGRFDVTEHGTELHIDVEGDGFLYRMVRNLVGTLTEVGRGHRTPEWVTQVRKAKDRAAAGPCAPAKGLCLMEVRYE